MIDLTGKTAVVFGLANKRSIAWDIALKPRAAERLMDDQSQVVCSFRLVDNPAEILSMSDLACSQQSRLGIAQ